MRHAPRNLRLACDHKGLTHFGGIYFFRAFLRVLQLRNFLSQHLTYLRRNHRYSLSQMILALVYPIVLGLDRLETASFLRSNSTFQYLTARMVKLFNRTIQHQFTYDVRSACKTKNGRGCWPM